MYTNREAGRCTKAIIDCFVIDRTLSAGGDTLDPHDVHREVNVMSVMSVTQPQVAAKDTLDPWMGNPLDRHNLGV